MKLALAIAFTLVEITSCLKLAQAQLSPSVQIASKRQNPPVGSLPPERYPIGTRGPCENTNIPFTPLLPVTESKFSGFTLTGHPTFWFYVPYRSSVNSGKFLIFIEGQQNNPVYQTDLKLPKTPGFVSVTLPTEEKPLEMNQRYRWKFRLYCASDDPSYWVEHRGTVQRVELPSLETQLKTATLENRINLYVENNIWYDTSTDLAKIHDLPQAWLKLLETVGLKQLNLEPISGSVVSIRREN